MSGRRTRALRHGALTSLLAGATLGVLAAINLAVLAATPTRPTPAQAGAADRAINHLAVLILLATVIVAVDAQRVLSRARLRRAPVRLLNVRRVRQQHRLFSRSWIELDGVVPVQRFPVYFNPVLVTLDSPTRLPVHGAGALRAVRLGDRWVYPSGRVRSAEPPGQLLDNPTHPDAGAGERAARSSPLRRQLQVDGVLMAPAPFVGIFWALLDGGGVLVWLGATVVTAVLALWGAAMLGSDPS